MMLGKIKFRIGQHPDGFNKYKLWILTQHERDPETWAAESLQFKQYPEGEMLPHAQVLDRSELIDLMDELWQVGIRPTKYNDSNQFCTIERGEVMKIIDTTTLPGWPPEYDYGMPVTTDNRTYACNICGDSYHHPGRLCPMIKEIEYYENGRIKRIVVVK